MLCSITSAACLSGQLCRVTRIVWMWYICYISWLDLSCVSHIPHLLSCSLFYDLFLISLPISWCVFQSIRYDEFNMSEGKRWPRQSGLVVVLICIDVPTEGFSMLWVMWSPSCCLAICCLCTVNIVINEQEHIRFQVTFHLLYCL